jgi:hypothetical protein
MCYLFDSFAPLQSNRIYEISPISEMNELYLSIPEGKGSDHIFEKKHVDGPFFFLPYCYVYRCVLGLSYNEKTTTYFDNFTASSNLEKSVSSSLRSDEKINPPLCSKKIGLGEASLLRPNIKKITLDIYDFVAFDYNRMPHYINSFSGDRDDEKMDNKEPKWINNICLPTDKDAPRVIYKLHYIIYPKFLPSFVVQFYKKIHVLYNNTMRFLFVNSLLISLPMQVFLKLACTGK